MTRGRGGSGAEVSEFPYFCGTCVHGKGKKSRYMYICGIRYKSGLLRCGGLKCKLVTLN